MANSYDSLTVPYASMPEIIPDSGSRGGDGFKAFLREMESLVTMGEIQRSVGRLEGSTNIDNNKVPTTRSIGAEQSTGRSV